MTLQMHWRTLQREHQQSMSEPDGPGPADERQNLMLAGICALAALTLFAIVGYRAGFEAVHGLGRYLPAAFLEALSELGATLPAICLLALLVKRQPRVIWMGILASAYATTFTHFLKVLCDSARPPAVLGDWALVTGPMLRHYSFPSGHTVTAFLLAGCFSVGAPRSARLLLCTLAAAVGLSRIWIGVHWPIDVIVGAGVAGLSIALSIRTLGYARYRPGLAPQLSFVFLVAVCAALELKAGPGYSLARLLRIAIASISLAALARDYLFLPMLTERAALRSIPARPGSEERLD